MKKILLIIGLLVTVFVNGQLPTIPGFTNINQKYQWVGVKPPPDTIYSKYGFAQIGDTIYVGNGTKWARTLLYIPTNDQPGDYPVKDPTNTYFTNQRPTNQACNNTGNIQLSWVSGLTFAYPSVPYTLNCFQYTLTNGTITAATGTASAGEFRQDLVYADASGLHIRQGDNSVGGVVAFPQIDPATELFVAYIRIDAANTIPTDLSNTKVYFNNTQPGEFTHFTTGTITAVFNYQTTPFSPADSSIHITAAANNGRFTFQDTLSYSKSLYTNLTFEARNNATFNNARNWVVRLFNGVTQVGNAVTITNWGYSKTLLNTWMLVSIPMSAFGGTDAFNRIEFRNTGTGGTVNVQFGDVKLQKGIVVGNPATGDFVQKTPTDNQLINSNNLRLDIKNTFTNFQNKDSVGFVLNYPWSSTSLLPYLNDGTSAASVTQGGSFTLVNGAAYDLNNYFSLPFYVGAENWTLEFDIQHTLVNHTNRGIIVGIDGQASGLGIQFNTSDTALYISKMNGMTLQDQVTNNKNYTNFILANNDIVHYKIVKFRRTVTATMHNMTNGSESKLVDNGVLPQVGLFELHFLNAGDTKLINSITLKYDEVKNPDYMAGINSITWGSAGDSYNDGYYAKTAGKIGGYSSMQAAPGESSAQIKYRLHDILLIHPTVFSYGNPVNDLGIGMSTATYSHNIDSATGVMVAAGIKVVLISGTPSTAGDVRPYNDTLLAIGGRYGIANVRNVDVFSKLKDPAGNYMLAKFNPSGDGIHPGNAGHEVISAAEYDAVNAFIGFKNQILTMQVPFNPNTSLDVLTTDVNNHIFKTPIFLDTFHVKIFQAFNAQQLQSGNAMIGGGFYAQHLIIGGSGSFGSSDFNVDITYPGITWANKFFSNNIGINTAISGMYVDNREVRLVNGSTITGQQAITVINRIPHSTSDGLIVTNLNDGFVPGANYNVLNLKRTDTSVFTVNPFGRVMSKDSTVLSSNYDVISRDRATGKWGVSAPGGGGSPSPDNINGTATADVGADMGGFNLVLSNAANIQIATAAGSVNLGSTLILEDDRGTPHGFQYDGDYSAGYTARSIVDKGYVDAAVAGAGSGANTGLSNLSSVAINSALLPGTDNSIALGSSGKQWTNVFGGSGGGYVWSDASITHTAASTIAYQSANGTHQFYKSGQASALEIYNTTITDGLKLTTISGNPELKTISGSANLIITSSSGEKTGIGGTPTSKFHDLGSFGLAYIAKATSYTATVDDCVIEVTATGQIITLPTAASIAGRLYTIKLTSTGSCTIATTSSQTIDGSTTYSLASQYKYVTIQSNGANWIVIANN